MEALGVAARRTASVLAVDDQPAFMGALRCLIEACGALTLAGEATSGEAAIALVAELEPDVVLMDVQMPGMGGIAAACEIKRRNPEVLLVLLSATRPADLPPEAHECCADAMFCKSDIRPSLLDSLWAGHTHA